MRAPVSTWTPASVIAAVASQTFDAIVVEKTDVMMSVYFDATLARNAFVKREEPTGYDGRVSTPGSGWPLRRIVVLPLVLFVAVSATAFTLAKLHLAKPSTSPAGSTTLGDAQRGEVVFRQTCAACHGKQAQGGVGPRLAGAHITIDAARAQIDNGGSVMPAKLVTGGRENDVLAYLARIVTSGGS
jgi:mono/diheme cytochrome c family protein